MKAEISADGVLIVSAETIEEAYDMSTWKNENFMKDGRFDVGSVVVDNSAEAVYMATHCGKTNRKEHLGAMNSKFYQNLDEAMVDEIVKAGREQWGKIFDGLENEELRKKVEGLEKKLSLSEFNYSVLKDQKEMIQGERDELRSEKDYQYKIVSTCDTCGSPLDKVWAGPEGSYLCFNCESPVDIEKLRG